MIKLFSIANIFISICFISSVFYFEPKESVASIVLCLGVLVVFAELLIVHKLNPLGKVFSSIPKGQRWITQLTSLIFAILLIVLITNDRGNEFLVLLISGGLIFLSEVFFLSSGSQDVKAIEYAELNCSTRRKE